MALKCLSQMKPKSSSLASPQSVVFVEREMLSMTQRKTSSQSSVEMELFFFKGTEWFHHIKGLDSEVAFVNRQQAGIPLVCYLYIGAFQGGPVGCFHAPPSQ